MDQLKAIVDNLNGTYILDADLNLAGITWIPIGTEDAPFTGYFYGNGHQISNLTIADAPIGGIFGIYELLPAFIISCIAIVVASLLSKEPSDEIKAEFENAKAGITE